MHGSSCRSNAFAMSPCRHAHTPVSFAAPVERIPQMKPCFGSLQLLLPREMRLNQPRLGVGRVESLPGDPRFPVLCKRRQCCLASPCSCFLTEAPSRHQAFEQRVKRRPVLSPNSVSSINKQHSLLLSLLLLLVLVYLDPRTPCTISFKRLVP